MMILDPGTTFEIEICTEALQVHDEGCCTVDTRCDTGAMLTERLAKINARLSRGIDPKTELVEGDRRRPQGGAPAANQYGVSQVARPSEKQMAFIGRLVNERQIPEGKGETVALRAFHAGTINKRQASDLIDWLTTLSEKVNSANLASEKQVALIQKLLAEKDLTGTVYARWNDFVTQVTKKEASAAIDHLFSLPVKQQSKPKTEEIENGMYLVDGKVVKVQRAVHGSGNMYAKALDTETGTFDYVPGLVRKITPTHRMTLEQAKEFGHLYGVCCRCGRTLTDENSIEAGIGPVCASKF